MVSQGDIIKINFNPSVGHEQRGYRPALVVSTDDFNRYTHFAILCPITNSIGNYPLNVNLDTRTSTTGTILCAQMKCFDMDSRGWRFIEKVPNDLLEDVKSVLSAIIS